MERRVAGTFNPRDLACIAAAFAAALQGAAVAALPSHSSCITSPAAEAEGAKAAQCVFDRLAREAIECEEGLDRFDPQARKKLGPRFKLYFCFCFHT